MNPFCAAVDWGTSSFRLWLLDADGHLLAERRSADGMSACVPDKFESVLEGHLAAVKAPPGLPVVICGMAGSRQGWIEVPYCSTPVALSDIAPRAARVPVAGRDIHIVPGIAQRNAERPDVMRGEETQLIGAVSSARANATVCMPGSHSKWVTVMGGTVQSFRTFMTGELYAAIRNHTILRHAGKGGDDAFDAAAFERGVRSALTEPQALTALLFGVRAGELLGYSGPLQAPSLISGLVIGTEIAAATQNLSAAESVSLVCSGTLADRYAAALAIAGRESATIDADTAVRAGLLRAAIELHAPVPRAASR